MRTTIVSEATPGQENEDFAGATAGAAVLLDGAGMSGVDDGGCRHGVAWYTRHLGGMLLAGLAGDAGPAGDARPAGETGAEAGLETTLAAILGNAIDAVANLHRGTCDLTHPGTPSATVVMLRRVRDRLEYLVLADSTLVLTGDDGHQALSDGRAAVLGRQHQVSMDALPNGTPEHDQVVRENVAQMRAYRNRPGGFWVAAVDPEAATQALTGVCPAADIRSAILASDGAARLVDRFALADWSMVEDMIATAGPQAVIGAVRAAEHDDPQGRRWPRAKRHDDATLVYCDWLDA